MKPALAGLTLDGVSIGFRFSAGAPVEKFLKVMFSTNKVVNLRFFMTQQLVESLKLSLQIFIGKDVVEETVLVLIEQTDRQK